MKYLLALLRKELFDFFYPNSESQNDVRLTSVGMQDSLQPENGELNIIEYEGNAIAIQGHSSGGWIYSASIIDTGDPIVTVLVHKVFEQNNKGSG